MAQQGSPPPRPGRLAAGRRGDARDTGRSWDESGAEEEYPPWAGPAVAPRRDHGPRPRGAHGPAGGPGGPDGTETWNAGGDRDQDAGPRPPGSRRRMAAARSRRRSRITWVWGIAAFAVVLIVAGVLYQLGRREPAPESGAGFVTTFQPGEMRTVPGACTAVSATTLNQYLPGKRLMVAPHSLDGSAQSLCNWTLDAPPMYRVLAVNMQAYSPSGLATGDGSATFAAIDAYGQALGTKRHPGKATHLPPATVTPLHGLGSAGFAALQVVLARGDSTDLETVVVRDHNVLITVVVQGPHRRSERYSAAPQSELQSAAIASARDLVTSLR